MPTGKSKASFPTLIIGPFTKDASLAPVVVELSLNVIELVTDECTIPLVKVATSVIIIPPVAIVFVAPPEKVI